MLNDSLRELNQAVRRAGGAIRSRYGKPMSWESKTTSADVVTAADLEAEGILVAEVERLFPDYSILSEELGFRGKSSHRSVVIDPLDGTNNFTLEVPVFSVSVAVLEDDEPVYAIVHEPITESTTYAVKGSGAWRDGRSLTVTHGPAEKDWTVAYFCDYEARLDRVVALKSAVTRLGVRRLLDLWSPAITYVRLAAGAVDAIVNDGTPLHDVAAGLLIAREAGARVTDFSGEPFVSFAQTRLVVSGGAAVHRLLTRMGIPLEILVGWTTVPASSSRES